MEIPRTLDDITPEWLTGALRAGSSLEMGEVASISFEPIGEGKGFSGAMARLVIEYSGVAGSAPSTIVAKFATSNAAVREFLVSFGLYERETRFYLELGQEVGIPIPKVYYGDSDPKTGFFIILMEDMSTMRAGDQMEGCSIEEARLAVKNAGRLHGRWWNSERLGDLPWLGHVTERADAHALQDMYLRGWAKAGPILKDISSPEVYSIAERYGPKLAEMWTGASSGALTLNHGDYRIANMFFGDDEVVVLDWQLAMQGPPVCDVAYFLTGALTLEERRSHEESLLDTYLEVLREEGVEDYSRDQMIHDYRFGMFRGLLVRVGAIANLDLDNEAGRALIEHGRTRSNALTDWDCGELIPD